MRVGDYVLVESTPKAWGAIEAEEARQAYVGHVGVVKEIGDCDYCFLVFCVPNLEQVEIGQRWFEPDVLTIVSSPKKALPSVCYR